MNTITLHLPARLAVSAAILAGGASRRMGTDKALMTLAGQTLLERAIACVAHVSDDIMIVGDREAYHRFGVPVVADAFPGSGTLGGIATALRRARHEYVLVVGCDMPFLSGALLEAMANEPRDYDALVPVTGASRTYETLHAIYRRRCLIPIERRIARDELRVVDALADLRVRALSEAWLRRFDPVLDSFVNANHPDEWAAAKARLGNESSTVEDRE